MWPAATFESEWSKEHLKGVFVLFLFLLLTRLCSTTLLLLISTVCLKRMTNTPETLETCGSVYDGAKSAENREMGWTTELVQQHERPLWFGCCWTSSTLWITCFCPCIFMISWKTTLIKWVCLIGSQTAALRVQLSNTYLIICSVSPQWPCSRHPTVLRFRIGAGRQT